MILTRSAIINRRGAFGILCQPEVRERFDRGLLEARAGRPFFGRDQLHRALTSHDIKLEKKGANIAGLQLADILAHPAKQSMLVAKGVIPEPGDVFGRELMRAVAGKFNVHEGTGQVEGYGEKWL